MNRMATRMTEFPGKMSKVAALVLAVAGCAHAAPVHLRTNALENPLGVDTVRPVFSWQSDAKTKDWMQGGYGVLVAADAGDLKAGKAVWDSGRVTSSESVGILYGGGALRSQQRYWWKVRVWDSKGKEAVSEAAWFETGMMSAGDWKADWILRHDPADEQEIKAIRWIWVPGGMRGMCRRLRLRSFVMCCIWMRSRKRQACM